MDSDKLIGCNPEISAKDDILSQYNARLEAYTENMDETYPPLLDAPRLVSLSRLARVATAASSVRGESV
jgi:hypothetical protein